MKKTVAAIVLIVLLLTIASTTFATEQASFSGGTMLAEKCNFWSKTQSAVPVLMNTERMSDHLGTNGSGSFWSSRTGSQVEQQLERFVGLLRFTAILIAVFYVTVIAFTLIGDNPEKMSAVKIKAVYIIVALFIALQTEMIVGFIWRIAAQF